MMADINYLAVLVAGVASMIIGYIWYGPLFGKAWARGMGWDTTNQEQMGRMKKMAGPAYVQQFIGALIMAYVLAHVVWMSSVALPDYSSTMRGINSGFFSWLGFVLPVKYGDKLWTGKKFKYVAIDLGYYLVLLIVMGLILSCWR
jgi:hypothetical protein